MEENSPRMVLAQPTLQIAAANKSGLSVIDLEIKIPPALVPVPPNFEALVNAFSVEKLSIAFFNEYTLHYENFIQHLNATAFKKTVFKSDEKAIRDFTKKLLGRIVFLYFVQKKGWLGATNTNYKDGDPNFMMNLFNKSGGDESFYSNWLTVLFFETLNQERANDDFKMPDGKKLKVPFLNGGLFDKEEHDEHLLTFKAKFFP